MSHDYEAQRADTFETFTQMGTEISLPKMAIVDFQFYPDDIDAQWDALEAALRDKGFKTTRYEDEETLDASIGPIEVNPESIWKYERIATEVALKFDFNPDGWGLVED
ncbi:MAG: ribonuclease E inhibitor RraB [Paracoccaceae bacterium]